MKRRWWYFLLYVFLLPHTLVGLLMSVFYWPTKIRWSDGCIEMVARQKKDGTTRIWGRPGAQTWGFLIWYSDDRNLFYQDLRVHERCHVVQACVMLGLPFVLAYVGDFLFRLAFLPKSVKARWPNSPRWYQAYRAVWAEVQAYDRQYKFRARELDFLPWGAYENVSPIPSLEARKARR